MEIKRFKVFLLLCVIVATMMYGAGCGGVPSNTSENKSGILDEEDIDLYDSFDYEKENEHGISYKPHEYYEHFSDLVRVRDLDGEIINVDIESFTYGSGWAQIVTSDGKYRITTGLSNVMYIEKLK